MRDWVMIRLNKELVEKMRETAGRHPLKPTLRASVERAIELMIEDLEEELKNVNNECPCQADGSVQAGAGYARGPPAQPSAAGYDRR